MAYTGKKLVNEITGQHYHFKQTSSDTGGALLEMETAYLARSNEPVAHYHPTQKEDFLVLEGEITVRMNGEIKKFRAGDHFHIPQNTVHGMWNETDSKVALNWQIRPALNTEYFFETAVGLANDGKTDDSGYPKLLQKILLASRYSNEFRSSKPAYGVQKVMVALLKPVAILAGFKSFYKQYVD